jgi:hypothetical protein
MFGLPFHTFQSIFRVSYRARGKFLRPKIFAFCVDPKNTFAATFIIFNAVLTRGVSYGEVIPDECELRKFLKQCMGHLFLGTRTGAPR